MSRRIAVVVSLILLSPDVAPAQGKADRVQPGDRLFIHVANTLPNFPSQPVFRGEPGGKVALGPGYGRVAVAGGTLEDAESKIQAHLSESILRMPYTSVTRYDPVAHGGVSADQGAALERRVQQLEEEVRELRAALEGLR